MSQIWWRTARGMVVAVLCLCAGQALAAGGPEATATPIPIVSGTGAAGWDEALDRGDEADALRQLAGQMRREPYGLVVIAAAAARSAPWLAPDIGGQAVRVIAAEYADPQIRQDRTLDVAAAILTATQGRMAAALFTAMRAALTATGVQGADAALAAVISRLSVLGTAGGVPTGGVQRASASHVDFAIRRGELAGRSARLPSSRTGDVDGRAISTLRDPARFGGGPLLTGPLATLAEPRPHVPLLLLPSGW